MALLNRPLTAEEAKTLIDSEFVYPLYHELFKLIAEPRYQCIRYDASINRIVYEARDTFYLADDSPSDCRWIVPGAAPLPR